jgi:dCMP deaminase
MQFDFGRSFMTKWDVRFMGLAKTVADWSSCYKDDRHVGAVITKDKRILTTGYNGAPSGIESCSERGNCIRVERGIPSGTQHEVCFAVHAEQNAIIQAARLGIELKDAVMYVTHQPCVICAKMIINSGISKVVFDKGYPDNFSLKMFKEAGIELVKFDN